MATIEKLVHEIKQLPPQEKEILLGILQQETEANQAETASKTKETFSTNPMEPIDLEPELKWLIDNGWVLDKYRGEYLALKGYELIAHGSLSEVMTESKRRGIDQPFTQYLPKTEREWLLGQGNYPSIEP